MIDLPMKAEVNCMDGAAGRSTYVIGNPDTHELTHLVVKSFLPPFHEYLVPVDQVVETTPEQIRLKCTRDELNKMEPFEYEAYIKTELPSYIRYDAPPIPGYTTETVTTYVPVKRQNIPYGEITLRHGARVEATDGYLGQVDELLINSNNQQVTHLVMLEKHMWKQREITIPVSQIDRVSGDVVYLKMDRQSVEMLPTTPIQRWSEDVKDSRLERRIKMDKMIVVVFDSESKAYEGSKALQDLQDEGSINLYAKAVITRDSSGRLAVKQQDDMGPVGTSVGLFVGSLIGMIGGPLGLVIGASAGMSGGLLYDLAHLGVGEDFLAEVEKSLQPGKAAVVAEIWEVWTLPVDTRMETLGGVVLRRTRKEVVDTQIERDVALLKADLAELEAERDQATGEARAKLQAKVDTAKARLQAVQDDIRARIEVSKNETEAKVKFLQEQATKDSDERKAKREVRISELKADHMRRSDLLKRAWELTKQALSE